MSTNLLNISASRVKPKTPLHEAAIKGKFRSFKNLYKKAVSNPAETDGEGKTIMHYACEHPKNDCKMLRFLIKNELSLIDEQDAWKRTPLHIAVENANMRAIELLMKAGADEKLRNCRGKTPAQYAQEEGFSQLLQRLQK